jgi:predicted amidohydrolase
MILASAQTCPEKDNIDKNLEQHYALCEKAIDLQADLIVFPELSISGYEREEAYNYFFTPDDARLIQLKKTAIAGKITIIAGAPIKIKTDLFIGSFIFSPAGNISIYTKQYLHEGEDYFYKSSFDFNPQLDIENQKISLGICADVENIKHVRAARNTGSKIYVLSVFYSSASIQGLHEKLNNFAREYRLNIILSNFYGECYNMEAGGKSAFWANNGSKIAELDTCHPGILVVENTDSGWIGERTLL